MDAENATLKQRGWPFAKGQSGNPAGKRPGTRHRATVLAERLMEGEAEAVVRKVVEAARAGDMTAARLILDRIAPPRRGRPVALTLPEVAKASDLPAAQAAVVAAVGDGSLSPEEAAAVSAVIEAQRRAIDTAKLDARLRAVEEKVGTDEQRA